MSGLRELQIRTVWDLLCFFPKRYEDRLAVTAIKDLSPETQASVRCSVLSSKSRISPAKGILLTEALVTDGTGIAKVLWFNRTYLSKSLKTSTALALHGPVVWDGSCPKLLSPELEFIKDGSLPETIGRMVAFYGLKKGLTQYFIRSLVKIALEDLSGLEDPLPSAVKEKLSLMDLKNALFEIHRPASKENLEKARKRLVFDEFFFLQTGLGLARRLVSSKKAAPVLPKMGPWVKKLFKSLPFVLTESQRSVIEDISSDMASGFPMMRLLQGDVGSGKTAVALTAMMQCLDGGCQSAMMVPTSLLAQQHYLRFKSLLDPLGVKVLLLTSSMAQREKALALEQISSGEADLVIGTHALISSGVDFKNLGLAVVDEQHRFGVLQRGKLAEKAISPHLLVMTATPIPRTLALTLYGDLDISLIRRSPEGRLPVKSRIIPYSKIQGLYGYMEKEIEKGHRIYWVCPVIEKNPEEGSESDLRALESRFEDLKDFFSDKVSMVHGRTPMEERLRVMEAFKAGERPILASTTVIEVGLDVPEATVMVIEGPERFGLFQLHQLRGRVGRGKDQSWCFLLIKSLGEGAAERLGAFVSSSDGFKMAESDMAIRGPGQFLGLKQHGSGDFKIADLTKDSGILELARKTALELLDEDENLSGFPNIKAHVLELYGKRLNLAGAG